MLLLDEPTNNLDAPGLELMVDFVTGHEGPVMVASHDRDFLDRVATNVVELDLAQQRIGHYTGGWSEYVAARSLERRQAREAFEEYAETRDRLLGQSRQRADWADKGLSNIKRSGEADKHIREKHRARADRQAAKAARIHRAADRLAVVDQPRKEWELRYAIDAGPESAEVVWTLDRVVLRRGEFELGPIDLTVSRGDRLLLAGDNGTGKTTLLAAMLGELPVQSGRVSVGSRVRLGADRPGAVAARPRTSRSSTSSAPSSATRSRRVRCARCWPSSGSAPSTSTGPRTACRWASAPAR